MDIRVFSAKELNEWVQSPSYQQMDVIPISPHRALSYFHNPRGLPEDPVCFTAWEGGNLIGFRTVFADHIPREDSSIRFGWLSGVWVSPSHRRKGIARRLLEAALEAWDHKLMTHNNTDISRSVYLHSGHFETYHVQKGRRFYLRFDSKQLLAPKHPLLSRLSGVLGGIDWLGNRVNDVRWKGIGKGLTPSDPMRLSMDELSSHWKFLLNTESRKNLSQRGVEEIQWMVNYPWIIPKEEAIYTGLSYPFSSYRRVFNILPLGLLDDWGNPAIFLLLCQVDTQLIIPFYFGPTQLDPRSALGRRAYQIILDYLITHRCNMLTAYHRTLIGLLSPLKRLSLYSKVFEQVYLSSPQLTGYLPHPQTCLFQDGEGDFGFTG